MLTVGQNEHELKALGRRRSQLFDDRFGCTAEVRILAARRSEPVDLLLPRGPGSV
jgi:type IV pilus biogenesis protein CpaD/CtpE